MSGTLFIVATPIGNLDDLTPRARQTLAEVDLIAAEDTRHTGRLLRSIGAETAQKALHDHNEAQAVPALIEALQAGRNVALVSDAGTPLVSDPGYRLVAAAHANRIAVSPVPGPSAMTAALSAAGLPADRFAFEGFLPAKAAARKAALAALVNEPRTLVIYESVHRIADTLRDCIEALGADRQAFIGRELSKLHEQCVQTSLGELLAQLESGVIACKGEFVLLVQGLAGKPEARADVAALIDGLSGVLPDRQAAQIIAQATGERKNDVYARLIRRKNKAGQNKVGKKN